MLEVTAGEVRNRDDDADVAARQIQAIGRRREDMRTWWTIVDDRREGSSGPIAAAGSSGRVPRVMESLRP
jgi:hypothetical protein